MLTLIAIIHVLIALFLILIVLMQDSKGGAMGAFGSSGGSKSLIGAAEGGNILSKVSWATALIFSITCLTLAYLSATGSNDSVIDSIKLPTTTSLSVPLNTNDAAKDAAPATTPTPAEPAKETK